ncbi:mechanosensitive ion channel [Grosmannia clavigera kw1407]|uniref:Mechanosensitive ion channel n=1 Tax=Grosmannia clavigera (strain kw1407 / UAMH 11150) TaxID=655863 RepID=F0XAF2_GROCL|nr:mechanosensitive ion channel [Grosmannia clavigera kw1407]EFX05611.1 mechanosensitive ion channel [Grosmannia clavigera kw1407]
MTSADMDMVGPVVPRTGIAPSLLPFRDDPTASNPFLDERDLEQDDTVMELGERAVKRVWGGFMDFALQGNILEIAFGLIIAASFTAIVNSFVSDILLPPLSVLLPLNKNLDEKFAVLQPGPSYAAENGYNTLQIAQDDGAVVMAYGVFLNRAINFLGVGISLYALAGLYQYFSHDPIIKHTVKCKYCRKRISEKALRCVNCTSWLDGREERRSGM